MGKSKAQCERFWQRQLCTLEKVGLKMSLRLKIVVPVLVLGAGLVVVLPFVWARKSPTANERQVDAINEAVLLWSLKGWKHSPQEPVYLAINRQNPPLRFIERLKKRGIRILAMSKSPMPYAMGRAAAAKLQSPQFSLGLVQMSGSSHAQLGRGFVGGADPLTLELPTCVWKVSHNALNRIS